MKSCCNYIKEFKAVIVMLLSQALSAGINVFYKLSVADGMSPRILVAYRYAFGTACVAPLAFVFERNSRPKLTWMVLFQGFLSGLCGGMLSQNTFIVSLTLTSATFATAMSNLIPAATFLLAILFRFETVQVTQWGGIAKLIGTLCSVGGAMVLTFYRGVEIHPWSTNINLADNFRNKNATPHNVHNNDHLIGSLLATASCLLYAIWFIIQAKLSRRYPLPYSCTALMSGSAAIQGTVYALIMERDWSAWKLGLDIRLLTCFYAGVCSTASIAITSWCIREKGPIFASAFLPVVLIYVAIVGSLLLNEKLYLGSIIGSIILILGLYCMLWGKGKDITPTQKSEESVKNQGNLEGIVVSPIATTHANTSSNST